MAGKFHNRLDMKQITILSESIDDLLTRLKEISGKFDLLSKIYTIDDEYRYKIYILKCISIKVIEIVSKAVNNKSNLLNLVSSVRYLFETLVHTELLKIEPEYK